MRARELKEKVEHAMPTREAKRFCLIACHVLWRELCHYAALSRHTFDFRYLEQGLHNTPDELRRQLQQTVDAEDGKHDALLLGYGLCSNGLVGITARTTPLVCVRAHDCITLLLGAKERYREYFDGHPGTYWYSPGWIEDSPMPGPERYEASLKAYTEQYGEDNARYLMESMETWMSNYTNAAYVDLGVGDVMQGREYTRRCAEWLDWNCEVLEGDPRLVRTFLDGEWNEEDFLVVQPGETIAASFDDGVITIKK